MPADLLGDGRRFCFYQSMKLHRSVSLEQPLLVVALEEEAQHLHVSDLPVLVTGIGKICAAASLSALLARQRPSQVINLGTAGALHDGLSGTHVIGRVIQHDFNDDGIFKMTGFHFGEPIELGAGPALASGDVFVNNGSMREALAARADLVDMEGYAVARVAREFGLRVTIVKEVSDAAGDGAGRTWKQSLDDCAERLGAWVRRELRPA